MVVATGGTAKNSKRSATAVSKRRIQIPRVYPIDELVGFYVDKQMDRTVHITFEEEDVIVIDVYDRAAAVRAAVGEILSIIEINLKSGNAKVFDEGR